MDQYASLIRLVFVISGVIFGTTRDIAYVLNLINFIYFSRLLILGLLQITFMDRVLWKLMF